MTNIERLLMEGKEYENNLLLFNRVNRLIDAVNGMQDILAEYKTMIQEAKQMSKEADKSITYLNKQIEELQKRSVVVDRIHYGMGMTKELNKEEYKEKLMGFLDDANKAFTHDSVEQPEEVVGDTPLFQEEHKFKKIDNNRCLSCGAKDKSDCCGFGGLHSTVTKEDLLVPDEVEFYTDAYYNFGMKFGMQILFLPNPEYVSNSVWQVLRFSESERDLLKCKLVPCKLEDVEVGEWVYANYELCLDEQDKYYLCIGDKLFCYIDEGVKEIAWGAMTNNLNVHYLYKVQPIE